MDKISEPHLTPTDLVATVVCPRKLWLFKYGIQLVAEDENVKIGKVIHETSFPKNKKELRLFDFGVLDSAVLKNGVIIEIKKSSKSAHLHILQVSAYLEWMLAYGMVVTKGIIKYPREKKTTTVVLDSAMLSKLRKVRDRAKQILGSPIPPPPVQIQACKSCPYNSFCWL